MLALAKRQMRELIAQAGNHPSCCLERVERERDRTPGRIAYFRAMRDFIRSSTRAVRELADDNLPKLEHAGQSAANDVDFLMMNQYFGAWHGPARALVPALDKVTGCFRTRW